MRMRQIIAPTSHPHVLELTIDPVDLRRIQHIVDEDRALRLLDVADGEPDRWVVRLGCASKQVREQFLNRWE